MLFRSVYVVYQVSSAPKPENVWVLGSRSFYGGLFFSISMQKMASPGWRYHRLTCGETPKPKPSPCTAFGAKLGFSDPPDISESQSESQSQPDHARPSELPVRCPLPTGWLPAGWLAGGLFVCGRLWVPRPRLAIRGER